MVVSCAGCHGVTSRKTLLVLRKSGQCHTDEGRFTASRTRTKLHTGGGDFFLHNVQN